MPQDPQAPLGWASMLHARCILAYQPMLHPCIHAAISGRCIQDVEKQLTSTHHWDPYLSQAASLSSQPANSTWTPPCWIEQHWACSGHTTRAWQQAKAKRPSTHGWSWIHGYVSKAPEPKRANWQTGKPSKKIKKKHKLFRDVEFSTAHPNARPPQELGSPPSQASETAPRPCWGHFEGRLAARAWRSDPSLSRAKSHDKLNLLIDICMYLHHVNSYRIKWIRLYIMSVCVCVCMCLQIWLKNVKNSSPTSVPQQEWQSEPGQNEE